MEIIGKAQKAHEKYICEKCDFVCSYLRDWNRHIARPKHQNIDFGNDFEKKAHKKAQIVKEYICNCGKKYNTNSGLWKHQKKCDDNTSETNENVVIEKVDIFDKELIITLVKQNAELLEIIKTGTNNVNTINNNNCNYTNNTNKTFNLQFFLNETCKDAMNISEFIDKISLQLSDLESIGKLGYVEGISNIIIKNLNALDFDKRPVHCSDVKREIIYVKDDDKWEKEEDDKQKIKQVISSVVSKNLGLLPEYQKKYPQCMNPESKKSDDYNKIIMETMEGGVKNKEKIIRKIAKEITIEK
jgi:hypothetical protein